MASFLDLPDDALLEIGTYFEHDIDNLKLYLQVHPRIYRACNFLRYRPRVFIFDSESPLDDYLTHSSYLRNVRSIDLITAFTKTQAGEIDEGRLGCSVRDLEDYDQKLARVISSLSNVRQVCLRSPESIQAYDSDVLQQKEAIRLSDSCEAIWRHTEISKLHIAGFASSEALTSTLSSAQNLPYCSILAVEQPRPRSTKINVMLPIAQHLAAPFVAARLRKLSLNKLHWSPEATEGDHSLSKAVEAIPMLPSLEHLSLTSESSDSRPAAAFLLAALRTRAHKLGSLAMSGSLLLEMAREFAPPATLHLDWGTGPRLSRVFWHSRYPSVELLTISGWDACLAPWKVMDNTAGDNQHPFPRLRQLEVIDNGFACGPEPQKWAGRQSFPVTFVVKNVSYMHKHDKNRSFNPVNWNKWPKRAEEVQQTSSVDSSP